MNDEIERLDSLFRKVAENRDGFREVIRTMEDYACPVEEIDVLRRQVEECDAMLIELYQHRSRAVALLADGGETV